MSHTTATLKRAQHGWPARFPVVQLPNAPLLVALFGWLVAAAATLANRTAKHIAQEELA
jgi:hypothetical protein